MKSQKSYLLLILLALIFFSTSCLVGYYHEPGDLYDMYYPTDDVQVGFASWYGKKFHGRPTSSGETYNMFAYTAAHRTLPFNTIVLVRNLENGNEVRVKINDRGPFKKGRIIDVSYAAAMKLGMINRGIAKVKVIVLKIGD